MYEDRYRVEIEVRVFEPGADVPQTENVTR